MSGNPKVPDRLNNGLNISLGILCKREGVQIQLTYILYLYMASRKSHPYSTHCLRSEKKVHSNFDFFTFRSASGDADLKILP